MFARMTTATLLGALLLIGVADAQVIESFEAGIPAGWTGVGPSGTSGITATVAPTDGLAFAWINSAGPYGTASGFDGSASYGSSLTSAPLALTGGAELSLDFDFMATDYVPYRDWVVVQLIDHLTSAVVATTANGQVNGNSCGGPRVQVVPAPVTPPPTISPGVTLAPATAVLAIAGGVVGTRNFCAHTGWITSSVTVPATGTYRLRIIATNLFDSINDAGVAIDNIRQTIPNLPPVADAGDDDTVECTSTTGDSVMLDGSGSSDPDGDALTYAWTAPAGVTLDDATSATPTGTFPLGSHILTLTVTDPFGATDSDNVTVTVQDTTAPTVDCMADVDILWPPNHGMVPVTFSIIASDGCTLAGGLTVSAASVTSSEPDDVSMLGDGSTTGDVDGTDGYSSAVPVMSVVYDAGTDSYVASLELRAERQGGGPGRTYTFSATVSDPSGNSADVSCGVFVPHSRGKK